MEKYFKRKSKLELLHFTKCRYPTLYLPISGIPGPNNDTTLVYKKQLCEVSPKGDLKQDQDQTKAQNTKSIQVSICLFLRGVRIPPRSVRLSHMLSKGRAPQRSIRISHMRVNLQVVCVRNFDIDTQNPSIFHTSLNRPYWRADNAQLGFHYSGHTSPQTPFPI
jgi:hypothetical protein